MNSYTFNNGKLITNAKSLEEFKKILLKVGYDSITTLNRSNNRLTSLPSKIGNLTNLTKFYCSYNSLTSLPSELGNMIGRNN